LELYTRELTPEAMANLFSLYKNEGEVNIIADVNTDALKTPSERLRSVIFVLWEQTSKVKTFEVYYLDFMEQLINKVKAKLN